MTSSKTLRRSSLRERTTSKRSACASRPWWRSWSSTSRDRPPRVRLTVAEIQVMRCKHCTAELTNGLALCPDCQQTLRVALVNVAAFHTDVLRIQPGERVKSKSTFKSTPPPSVEDAHDPISAV